MATVSVIYPREEGANFDFDYYVNVHLPLVGSRWSEAGLIGGEALKGAPGPDGGESPFFAIGLIHFESMEALGAAMNGEHASEIIGDIANFTTVRPVMQVNERIGGAS